MDTVPFLPYCGLPPVPGHLAWNTDPVLIGALVVVAGLYAWNGRGPAAPSRQQRAAFYVGWALVTAALVSPLCNISVALFSARISQHVVLTLVAAPLVALGDPGRVLASLLPARVRDRKGRSGRLPVLAAAGFAATLWAWHLPGPYDLTLQSDLAYWAMHVTTFGSALMLWHALVSRVENVLSVLAASLATSVQMSLLGGLLTLAPRPLFAPHAGTTWPWGLSPLEDQQLGGVIMWVPGGLLFLLFGLAALALGFQRLENRNSVPSFRSM